MHPIEKYINDNNINFHSATFSNPFRKKDGIQKVTLTIFPDMYQYATFTEQVHHENFDTYEEFLLRAEKDYDKFKQFNFITEDEQIQILQNRKGKLHITTNKQTSKAPTAHNREKNYIIEDGNPRPWLVSLGVMDETGKVKNSQYDKFRQFNRFLEFISDIADDLPDNGTIIDFGCGKSYLTFAMYDYLNNDLNKNMKFLGFDLKEAVIKDCQMLASELDYDIEFYNQDIKDFSTDEDINMIITLHACDTATDYALYHGIRLDAEVILSVPCCQKEVRGQIENKELDLLLKHGILKERFSSDITDALRVSLLEDFGYRSSIMEFIDTEHTAKNLLIRGIKSGKQRDIGISNESKEFTNLFNIKPTLYKLLDK